MRQCKLIILFLLLVCESSAQWTSKSICSFCSDRTLRTIAVIDSNNIYVAGYDSGDDFSIIYYTYNGGDTWIDQLGSGGQTTQNLYGKKIYDIDFGSSASHGFAVGKEGLVLRRLSQFAIWERLYLGITKSLASVTIIGDSTVYLAGTGDVLKSEDYGDNWDTISPGPNVFYSSLFFLNPDTGYLVGSAGTALKTTNGGMSWMQMNVDSEEYYLDIYFIDANVGYISGPPGLILKTVNGGTDWQVINLGVSTMFRSVSFSDANTGIAVGSCGMMVKTTNGFDSWSFEGKQSNFTGLYYDVAVTSSDKWLVIRDQKILSTETFGDVFNTFSVEQYSSSVMGCGGAYLSSCVYGGTGPYTFSWNPTDNLSDSTALSPFVTESMDSVMYTLTATDGTGQSSIDSVQVTLNAWQLDTMITDATCSTCTDGAISVTPYGQLPGISFLYAWYDTSFTIISTDSFISSVPPGKYYVEVYDSWGCISWLTLIIGPYTVIHVDQEEKESDLKIFPNPTSNTLWVDIGKREDVSIEYYSVIGSRLYHQNIKNHNGSGVIEIDITGLAPGAYFLKAEDMHRTIMRKFVVCKSR